MVFFLISMTFLIQFLFYYSTVITLICEIQLCYLGSGVTRNWEKEFPPWITEAILEGFIQNLLYASLGSMIIKIITFEPKFFLWNARKGIVAKAFLSAEPIRLSSFSLQWRRVYKGKPSSYVSCWISYFLILAPLMRLYLFIQVLGDSIWFPFLFRSFTKYLCLRVLLPKLTSAFFFLAVHHSLLHKYFK